MMQSNSNKFWLDFSNLISFNLSVVFILHFLIFQLFTIFTLLFCLILKDALQTCQEGCVAVCIEMYIHGYLHFRSNPLMNL